MTNQHSTTAEPTHREKLLAQALGDVLVAAGVMREASATGPELLHMAESYVLSRPSRMAASSEGEERPNPEYEAKAAAFRAEDRVEVDIREADVTVKMLETWFPEMFPANELGQVHTARCMAESAADMIRALQAAMHAARPDAGREVEPEAWRGRVEGIISEAVLSASVDVPEGVAGRVAMRARITKAATDLILGLGIFQGQFAARPDTRREVEPCFECGSTERIGTACKPCNPELAASSEEPTPEMIEAGIKAHYAQGFWNDGCDPKVIYAAMLAARPDARSATIVLADEIEGVISDLESSGWARSGQCINTLKSVARAIASTPTVAVPVSEERVEAACEVMHDAYELAAVVAGWETQQRSRKPWAEVPDANKVTMRAAVGALLSHLAGLAVPDKGVQGDQDSSGGLGQPGSGSQLGAAVGATAALADVAAERRRQVIQEGWAPERDDKYEAEELAQAAAAYALSAAGLPDTANDVWPLGWAMSWFKATTPRRDLIKAGALILAEIERLDRATASTTSASGNEQVAAVAEERRSREVLPQDVIDLIIAARVYAYETGDSEAYDALDKALEAFASRVPWENEPEDASASTVRGE